MLATAREGYRRSDVDLRDLTETVRYPGFSKLARRWWKTGAQEIWRDVVKAAFVKDPVVSAMDVKVDTFKGTVQLSGFVDTAEQKTRAEQIAAGVTGVAAVKNNITVKTATVR